MNLIQAIIQLRDDLKIWVTNNLLELERLIRNKGNYSDLKNAPTITNHSQDELLITDEDGNAILQVNQEGLNVTSVKTKKIVNDSNELLITDDSGNAIFQVNDNGLNTTNIKTNRVINNSSDFVITDDDGNAIFQVDKNGVKTTCFTADKAINNSNELIISDSNDNAILLIDNNGLKTTQVSVRVLKDGSSDFEITDKEGYTVLQVDKNGTHSTDFIVNGISIAKKIPLWDNGINDYNDLKNAPNITEDGTDNMVIVDEQEHIIFKADANGIHSVGVSVNGVDIVNIIDTKIQAAIGNAISAEY